MSSMGHVTCDDETVVAVLDFLKVMPYRQSGPLVASPKQLLQMLMQGGFIASKKTVALHSTQVLSCSLRRVAHELRRRGVHVEQSQRIPGEAKPAPGAPPANAFCIWCDEDALLDTVWRRAPEPMSASTAAPPMPIIAPSAIDPPRKPGQRATMGDG